MTQTNPIIAKFASVPSFVAPVMKDRFESCVNMLAVHPDSEKLLNHDVRMDADDGFWPSPDSWMARYRPYIVSNGILQIPVKGVLLNEFPFALGSWATGYEYIWRAYQRGMDDPDVRGIALVIDSPGGLVAGNFELVDKMYARRDEKPVWSFAHESAYSAAYSIASVGVKIVVSRTGGVGSIGVVTMHIDASGAYEKMGLKLTYIFAGKHKVDGNSAEALPDDVKERIQARIDELYGVFVSTVARNRPQLSEEDVRATEALCFTATQAVSAKLADEIGPLDDTLSAFAGDLDDQSDQTGKDDMADNANSAVDQAALDTARAEGVEAGKKEGMTLGATAERERIGAILGSDEAKGRESQALFFATKTGMTVEEATGALAAAPKAEAPKTGKGKQSETFEQAMGRTGNPELHAENEGDDDEQAATPQARANSIFESAGYAPRKG